MSYRCQKCQSVIYDYSAAHCSYCGSKLPPEGGRSASETADTSRKFAGSLKTRGSRFPSVALVVYLVIAGGAICLALRHGSVVDWSIAGLGLAAATNSVIRYARQRKRAPAVIP